MIKNFAGDSFSEVYHKLLDSLLNYPEYIVSPRGQRVHEITNCRLEIKNPWLCFYENNRRSSQYKYIAAELLWYLSGDRSLDFISQFSAFWKNITNPDITVNSNYGWLLFYEKYAPIWTTQWQWAYDSLFNDKDTRQAVMHFNLPKHQFLNNKDFVCTMYGDFLIRDEKLHFTIHMRSNDAILGLPTDMPFFCLLHINMWKLLSKVYPGLELGTYTHFVNSMHLYERNFQLVKEMEVNEYVPQAIDTSAASIINENGTHNPFVERLISAYKNSFIPDIHTKFEQFIWTSLLK